MIRRTLSFAATAFIIGLSVPALVSAQDKAADPVVAIANGMEIHLSEINDAKTRLPAQYQQIPFQVVYPMLVNSLIDTQLMAIEARKLKLDEDKDFKIRLSKIEDQLLERVLISRKIEKEVTEAKIKERFDILVKESTPKDEVRARHILLKTEAEAKQAIKDIKGGADFADVAAERSTGPSATKGGDLGYFSDGEMVPEFSKAAFAMKKGEVGEAPVKTQFGWHVIKVEDRRAGKPPTFESAKEEIRAQMSREVGAAYISELRKDADIKRFNADGSPLKETVEKNPKEGEKKQ